MTYHVGHLFICLFAIHLKSLLKCVFRPLPFFNWVVCFLIIEFFKVLYIIWTQFFYQICVLQIFSLHLWFAFLKKFSNSVFHRVKVLYFNDIQINISFMVVSLILCLKKSSSYLRSSRFSPILSYRSPVVFHFTFMLIIHIELIFVKGRNLCLDFFFEWGCLVILVPVSSLHWTAFAFSLNISWLYFCGPISWLSKFFHWYICLFFWLYHTFLITRVSLEVISFRTLSCFRTVLAVLCLLPFHKRFRIIWYPQNNCWDFAWNCTESRDQVGENRHLTNTDSSFLWTWYASPFT